MRQSPFSKDRKNQIYSNPTFQSTIFNTPITTSNKLSASYQRTPPPYAIALETPKKEEKLQSVTRSPSPPPYAINFDTRPDLDTKKKRSQKKHFQPQQFVEETNYFLRKTPREQKSSVLDYSQICQQSIQTSRQPLRTERNADSNQPYKEQIFLESRKLEDFKQNINKKIDSLNSTFNYEKRLLSKENIDVTPSMLTTKLRLLTQQYDEIDKRYDNDLKKIEKEKKTLYSQQLEEAIQSQKKKHFERKDSDQKKRELISNLQQIEKTKRDLIEEYAKLKKSYLNRSLHMQRNHIAQVSQCKDLQYLQKQVNDLEFLNRKKEEQNRRNIQIIAKQLKEPSRAVKPRSYDLHMFI